MTFEIIICLLFWELGGMEGTEGIEWIDEWIDGMVADLINRRVASKSSKGRSQSCGVG